MMRNIGPTPRLHRGLAISLSLLALGGCLNPNSAPLETGATLDGGAVQPQDDPGAAPAAESGAAASIDGAPVVTEAAQYVASPAPLKPVKVTTSARQSDAGKAIDGNLDSSWNSGPKQTNPTMVLDLGKTYELTEVRLKVNPDFGNYSIELSTDGTNYTLERSNQVNTTWNLETKTLREDKAARYVRLTFKNGTGKKAVMVFEAQPVGGVSAASPTPAPSTSASPSSSPSATPTASPSIAPSATPTPAPTPSSGTTDRAANTTPNRNVGGWSSSALQPTALNTSIAVSPDGKRAVVTWLHNNSGTTLLNGTPTMYASFGDPGVPSSFTPAQAIGKQPYATVSGASETRLQYNWKHNNPLVFPTNSGGFFWLGMPMNAIGYAQGLSKTGYSFVTGEAAAGATSFSAQSLAKYTTNTAVDTLSENSGGMDDAGAIHAFGQGHISNGDMAYSRRSAGATTWQNTSLAKAFRSGSLYYFNEGIANVSDRRNAQGRNDIHLAFGWTERGSAPMFGLYYLKSADGGATWKNAAGSPVSVPIVANSTDAGAAVVRANLGTSAYSGAIPGIHGLSVTETADGSPAIVRLNLVTGTNKTQANVYHYTGGRWVTVPVGGQYQRDANGTQIAINEKTGRVNVVLLDPGSATSNSRVMLFHQPLSDLQAGRANWTTEVIASIPNGSSPAGGFRAAVVPNTRFVAVVSPNYKFEARVTPAMLEVPMR